MKLQQGRREGTSCGSSQCGAAHSIPCCQGAVLLGSLLEIQPVGYTALWDAFYIKHRCLAGAPGFLGRSTVAFLDVGVSPSAQGGLQLPLAWLLPLLLLARPTPAPFPQGNCLFLSTSPQMASLVFPLLGKKFRGCTKFPYCNKNLGAPLGRTPQWRVGKRGDILRKEHLRVFLQKPENILLLKPCAQNLASSETGNCLTATYANSLDEFHSLKCELE